MSNFKGRGFLQLTGRNMPNNTITLSPLSSQPFSNITIGASGSGFDDWVTLSNPQVKKYQVIESEEDIISLSATMNRLKEEGDNSYYKMLDQSLFRKVTDADREKAAEIRKYYSQKIMMMKLKGSTERMSPFREDLNKLVHSDGTVFKENMMGMAYYLPIFHQYDTDLDSIKSQLKTDQNFDEMNRSHKPYTLQLSTELHPIKSIHRKTKNVDQVQYWFKDSKLDAGVMISVERKNQLKHLWDHIFTSESQMTIKGTFTRRRLDEFDHFILSDWDIVRG
jgi:hypothetical protein